MTYRDVDTLLDSPCQCVGIDSEEEKVNDHNIAIFDVVHNHNTMDMQDFWYPWYKVHRSARVHFPQQFESSGRYFRHRDETVNGAKRSRRIHPFWAVMSYQQVAVRSSIWSHVTEQVKQSKSGVRISERSSQQSREVLWENAALTVRVVRNVNYCWITFHTL